MIRVDELKDAIKRKGLSQEKVAEMLGISKHTFYDKMKKGVFNSNEIESMIELLDIEKPLDIFFTNFVA